MVIGKLVNFQKIFATNGKPRSSTIRQVKKNFCDKRGNTEVPPSVKQKHDKPSKNTQTFLLLFLYFVYFSQTKVKI
jgi:hypothetical protein